MAFQKKWRNNSGTRTYYAWRSMRARCLSPTHDAYMNYGGRGISVCDRWLNDFDAFVDDMGLVPDGYSLERVDVNGNYEPANCIWISMKKQASNRRNNVRLELNGRVMTLSQWALELGIGVDTLWRRINVYKTPLELALTKKVLHEWEHGSRAGYELHKCKCDICRKSNTERHRLRRARKAAIEQEKIHA